jgi:hypothetical protein
MSNEASTDTDVVVSVRIPFSVHITVLTQSTAFVTLLRC